MKKAYSAAVWLAVAAVVSLAATAAAASSANPGVVFELEVREEGQATQTLTTKVEGQNLRVEMPVAGAQPRVMIFRGDRNEMMMIDHAQQSYLVIDQAAMQQLQAQLAKMQEMMKNLPPEQRAMMEQMMKGRMGGAGGGAAAPPAELRDTGERAQQSGFPARKYEIWRGDQKAQEVWVTDWSNIDGASEVKTAFESMAKQMEGLLASLEQAMGGLMGEIDTGAMRFTQKMNGFPVLTRDFGDGGQVETETALKSVATRDVPMSEFEAPQGYRRQSMGGGR